MTIHVFIGVGPANLHRALKIQKIDPDAKLVFIDERLRPKTRDIDREKARANIFRFETEDVTAKLIAAGIKEEDLKPLIHQREFFVEQGFQSGDDTVFVNKPFTQIQIRDIQLLFMKTIDDLGGQNRPLLIAQKVVGHESQSIQNEVAKILYQQREHLNINPEDKQDIKIHVATGALAGKAEDNEIIYPDKAHYQMQGATDDVAAMPVTPVHGTTTFIIKDKITLDQLEKNQRSLDLTQWAPALKQFGWSLIRPPRIRVFYANDILYIGAEIPARMMIIKDKKEFEEQVTAYTRTIANLVFPDLPINELPVNPVLRSRFPTARGERGSVIKTNMDQLLPWGESRVSADVTLLTHGDSRYLPHYQTGSGFVTAFLQNELYAEIYGRNSFTELVTWAKQERKLSDTIEADQLKRDYEKWVGGSSELALKAFQQELFMAFSRDIIEHNKEKVGRYFNALHTQALVALGERLDELVEIYNRHQGTTLDKKQFVEVNQQLVAMELLHTNNIGFLRAVLPKLLNLDFSTLSDQEVIHVRDMHLLDFDKNLRMNHVLYLTHQENIKKIIDEALMDSILADYNKIHRTDYKWDNFNKAAKKIVLMEILNRSDTDTLFLRHVLSKLLNEDLSQLTSKEILKSRDHYTKDYFNSINFDSILSSSPVQKNIDELIKNLSAVDTKRFNKVTIDLKLPIIAKEHDAEGIRKNLLYATMNKQQDYKNIFYKNMQRLIQEEPTLLVTHLKTIIDSLNNNPKLHQRAFLSFFPGKYSNLIHQLASDMDRLLKTYENSEQLKIEALNMMMKFHSSLEEGHSRRTLEALVGITSEIVAASQTNQGLASLPLN